ncbi:MAG TPA: hypothetical protein VNU45_17855 [Rummeliibacillus sp.]|nr:hypothetical protein [Rummeliibacillus sp.]
MSFPLSSAGDLISQALQMVGVFSPSQPIDGPTAMNNLKLFNFLLNSFNSTGQYIPYFKEITFTLTPGKDTYTFSTIIDPNQVDVVAPRIIDLRYCNLIYQNISFPVQVKDRSTVYDLTRVLTNQTQPVYVVVEQDILLTKLLFYPSPVQAYECHLKAKLMLENVNYNDDITSLPGNYNLYLIYSLARMFDDIYAKNRWSQKQEADYQAMKKEITTSNDIDISVIPNAALSTGYYDYSYWPYYWPQVG